MFSLSSKKELDTLLHAHGMRIGDWGDISAVAARFTTQPCIWRPAGELQGAYVDFWHIARYLLNEERLLVSIDNSTFPREGEVAAFYECLGLSVHESHGVVELCDSFIATRVGNRWSESQIGRLSILLLFSTSAEWHIHFAAIGESGFRRVAVLDGTLFSFTSEVNNSAFQNCTGYDVP